MRTYYQIAAELYTPHVVPVLNAKQYDTGRGVDITLTDCGAVVVPGSSETLRLYCKKPDGTVSYLPGTLNGNAVRVDITNQLLALDGTVECELQVGTGSDMVSTPVFRLLVLPSNIDDSAIESSDEFTALETALETVEQYDTRIDALETTAAGLKAASRYGVANNLTQATAGANVLDAYQGKVLNDAVSTINGYINGETANGIRYVYTADLDALFNDITTNIVLFRLVGATGAPNTSSNNWIGLQWVNGAKTYGMQIAFTFSRDKIYIRRKNGSSTPTTWAET